MWAIERRQKERESESEGVIEGLQSDATHLCCGGKVPLSLRVLGAEEKFLTENTSLNSGTQ